MNRETIKVLTTLIETLLDDSNLNYTTRADLADLRDKLKEVLKGLE